MVPYVADPDMSTREDFSAFELANVYNGWKVPVGLAAHVLRVGTPYNNTCPHTQRR